MEFQFLLSSCLDIFEARLPYKTADQDFGLLQAVDERLAMYGWLTNTGVKIVVVVDMEGRPATALDSKAAVGLRDADLKPVSLDSSSNVLGLTTIRHSGRYKQHTSSCCGIRSTIRTSTHQSQRTQNRRLARRKSRAAVSSKK